MAKKIKAEIKEGWLEAGRKLTVLGEPIIVNGMSWTPVLFDDEEDPDFHKTAAIKIKK